MGKLAEKSARKSTQRAVEKLSAKQIERQLDEIRYLMQEFELEIAFEKVSVLSASLNDRNSAVLDILAEIEMERGNTEQAKKAFITSASLSPKDNPSKFFFLGQISSGKEALLFYKQGIETIEESLGEDEEAVIQLSEAYVAVAELFMTDLCFENDAEQNCEKALNRALELTPNSASVLQTYSSFKMSQNLTSESYSLLIRSYSLWKENMKYLEFEEEGENEEMENDEEEWIDIEENEEENIFEEKEETTGKKRKSRYTDLIEKDNIEENNNIVNHAEDIYENLPPQQFRFNTAKMFIEHSDYFHAIEIIESLLLEDNTIPEFWLLLGESILEIKRKNIIINENEKKENDEYDWEQVCEILEKAKELFERRFRDFPIDLENIETKNIMLRLETEIEIVKRKIIEGNASTSTST